MKARKLIFPLKRRIYGVFQTYFQDVPTWNYTPAHAENILENVELKEISPDELYYREIKSVPEELESAKEIF